MAKKTKQKATRASQPPGKSQEVQTPVPASEAPAPDGRMLDQVVEKTHLEASEIWELDDYVRIVNDLQLPETMDREALVACARSAMEAKLLFKEAQKRVETKEQSLSKGLETLKTSQDEVELGRMEVEEQKKNLDLVAKDQGEFKNSFAAREKALLQREQEIAAREAEADNDFIGRNRGWLAQHEAEMELFRKEVSDHQAKLQADRSQWEKLKQDKTESLEVDLAKRRDRHEQDLTEQAAKQKQQMAVALAQLEDEKKALDLKRREVKLGLQELKATEEVLAENKAYVDARVEAMAAQRVEQLELKAASLENRLETSRSNQKELAAELSSREQADRRFGNKPPAKILEELQGLYKQNADLEKQLAEKPSQAKIEHLDRMTDDLERLETDNSRLMVENQSLKSHLNRATIGVSELEVLRDRKLALEANTDLLRVTLEELRRDVEERIRSAKWGNPFPSCAKMDDAPDHQEILPWNDEIPDLKLFAEELQQRIAYDPNTGKELFYSAKEIRSFLGGLAMSRLHLLQGISGTGKTSLPLAFARAIGAGCAVIEVQAGWRDRQDLIGHFNAFEHRFYESPFLQALYKASCPRFSELPFIILLDEMNLSHPEQYFADLLSALEQDPSHQKLDLMTSPVDPAPRLLQHEGKSLALPQNVWFIGTANHDETTKDFADKTYDRAHVMELPRQRENFTINKKLKPLRPIALGALKRAFEVAAQAHPDAAGDSYDFLDKKLSVVLGDRFGIGWGNRLQNQMGRFVPVVMATGGSLGEATDHILATKLLRKIRDRHDNRPEDIQDVKKLILQEWPKLDRGSEPHRSLHILDQEMQRVGGEVMA